MYLIYITRVIVMIMHSVLPLLAHQGQGDQLLRIAAADISSAYGMY